MAGPVSAIISCRTSTFTVAEINTDVDMSHLSCLLPADPSAVLLRPVCSVVKVGTEGVRELSMETLALLTQYVCSLEMFS